MSIEIKFDSKESDPESLHGQGIRLARALKGQGFDIEVAGLIHLFLKALGVTQRELDIIHKEPTF